MRKNPGRKYRRNLENQNRTEMSEKKQAVNERRLLWFSNYLTHKNNLGYFKLKDKHAPWLAKITGRRVNA